MAPDLWALYALMYRSRRFEQAVAQLWQEGLISGEMHLGLGEEAIAAGVVSQIGEGDALALDHRGTPYLLARGADPYRLLREFMGCSDGLCGGNGGHMHLFDPERLAASSGIVGSSGPAAAGFALACQALRPGTAAAAFFGEGAMNQGMLLEAFNLAAAWKLPAVFVCKDNRWAITTRSESVTGGSMLERARGFGLPAAEVDGRDVLAVWEAARLAIEKARQGDGPSFLLAACAHLEGHFLGDALLGMARRPLKTMQQMGGTLVPALVSGPGLPLGRRARSLMQVNASAREISKQTGRDNDPLVSARQELARQEQASDGARLEKLEADIRAEVEAVVRRALQS